MSSYIEGFVGRVDAETVDVHHARHYRGRRTVGAFDEHAATRAPVRIAATNLRS